MHKCCAQINLLSPFCLNKWIELYQDLDFIPIVNNTNNPILIVNNTTQTTLSWFFVVVAVPSSVPTSQTAPMPLILASPPPAAPRTHSASWLLPQRATGGDVRSLAGCHPKETLNCCRVTAVVFSNAFSYQTHTGHHLLMIMLAKSRSQTEWASLRGVGLSECPSQKADCHYVPPPILLCGLCNVEAFDQNCLRQWTRQEHRDRLPWDHGMKDYRSWDFFFMQWLMRMRTISDDAMEVHFGLRLLDRAADHAAYCHNYPGVNQARELWYLLCWSSN